ncbi:Quaternary ammonium compound-resistance protein SugE [Klebsiella variicola]|nr:multidrug efflux SMR transporter [Klebsiella variicola]VCW85018.1 Quaternary ammonium compound-resistance protein SugE [Klebsiella variicola]
MNGWMYLVIAGIAEVFMPRQCSGLRDYPDLPQYFCLTFIGVSMYFCPATRTIPVGTAYAVWVGIGALGTAAYGIIYLNEDKGLLRIACFGLILAGIIGLKILAGHKQL